MAFDTVEVGRANPVAVQHEAHGVVEAICLVNENDVELAAISS